MDSKTILAVADEVSDTDAIESAVGDAGRAVSVRALADLTRIYEELVVPSSTVW